MAHLVSSTTRKRSPPIPTSSPPPKMYNDARLSGTPLPLLDAAGKPVPFVINYPTTDSTRNFLTHPNAASVVGAHKYSFATFSSLDSGL